MSIKNICPRNTRKKKFLFSRPFRVFRGLILVFRVLTFARKRTTPSAEAAATPPSEGGEFFCFDLV